MASLATKVKLYCEANSKTVDFTKDVLLQDDSDGKGPYIKEWNISGLDNQLDEMYKDMDAWKVRIKAIKDANPKS